MQAFLILLLKSAACSGILVGYYLLFLRNKKLHRYNRFYLLAATVISLLIPFIHFEWYSVTASPSNPVMLLQAVNYGDLEEPLANSHATSISAASVLGAVYLLVSIFLMLTLLLRIFWIYRLKAKATMRKQDGYTLLYTGSAQAPFSFLNYLFWKKGLDMEGDAGQQILRHELCHIREYHTLDKLFLQLVIVVAWANPFYWLIHKELALQHEFIADDAAIAGNDTEAFAMMILQSQYGNVYPDIIHPFFHSSIKRRIMMLTRSENTRFSRLRRLMALPLAASVLFLLSFKISDAGETGSSHTPVTKARNIISVVFDAGHGGMDEGGSGVNGLKEKDLTLKICNKFAALATEYNINVSLLRKSDDYIALRDRIARSQDIAADLFISIHVDKSIEESTVDGSTIAAYEADGFKVCFSGKNEQVMQSKLLASAIVPRLRSLNQPATLAQKGAMVINKVQRPAILIECGNIDDPKQMALLSTDNGIEKLCREILNGIADYGNSIK